MDWRECIFCRDAEAGAKRAVRSKQMSERCERTSERRSEWPSTLVVDFIVILPTGSPPPFLLSSCLLPCSLFLLPRLFFYSKIPTLFRLCLDPICLVFAIMFFFSAWLFFLYSNIFYLSLCLSLS